MLRFGGPQKIRGRAKIGPRPFSLTCVLHIGFENVLSCQQDASIAHRFHTMREKHPQKFNSRYSFTLCVCVWFSCNSTVICLEQRFQMWGLGPHSGALSCCFKVTGTQINFLVFVLICSFVGKPVRKKKLRTDPWSLVFVRVWLIVTSSSVTAGVCSCDCSLTGPAHLWKISESEKSNSFYFLHYRMKNKLWYFEFATSETISASCKKLSESLTIEVSGGAGPKT